MSSREIAKLCGKEHKNVTPVIKDLIDKDILTAEIQLSNFEHRGNIYIEYLCNKRDSLVIVARLSPEFTAAVIDRWQELENQQSFKLPTTYKEALLALIAKEEELETAIATKSEIGSRREATCMNRVSQLSKQLDKAKDYATIKRVQSVTGGVYNWRELKKSSVANDYPVEDVFDANYGSVKSYHSDAWLDVYGVDIEQLG
jgi:phage regulator Rha-like protein